LISGVHHDKLAGFVANEHIDWTNADADLKPDEDDTFDIGSASYQWAKIYGMDIYVGDDLFVTDRASIGTNNQSVPYSFGDRLHTLMIESDASNEYALGFLQTATDTSVPIFTIGKSRGTGSVLDNQHLGIFRFAGFIHETDPAYDKYIRAAEIGVIVDGTPSSSSMPAEMFFSTTPVGATLPTTRMTIKPDGGIFMHSLKSGTDQANAGAAAGELYFDTNDDNTIKMGV